MTKWASFAKDIERKPRLHTPHNMVRLHSAERVDDFSDDLWSEFICSIEQSDVRYYPESKLLNERISKRDNLNSENCFVADGSDRVIRIIFETFVTHGTRVIIVEPTFPMYEVYSKLNLGEIVKIPYHKGKIDLDMIQNAINEDTNLVILPNPSSPVGDAISPERIDGLCRVAAQYDCMVVIDEAYIDFSRYNTVANILHKPGHLGHCNLIVVRTFSKAWGSAGMRCGYALSQFENIEKMNIFAPMNDLCGITIKWINLLLDYPETTYQHTRKIIENRDWAYDYFSHWFDTINTDCNWIWVSTSKMNKSFLNETYALRYKTDLPGKPRNEEWIQLCIPANRQLLFDLLPQG